MHVDFFYGYILGYILLIVGPAILAFFSKYYSETMPIITVILGNVISTIISFYFLHKTEIELGDTGYGGFFKPFTPDSLLLWASFLNLIPQFLVIKLADKMKKT